MKLSISIATSAIVIKKGFVIALDKGSQSNVDHVAADLRAPLVLSDASAEKFKLRVKVFNSLEDAEIYVTKVVKADAAYSSHLRYRLCSLDKNFKTAFIGVWKPLNSFQPPAND